MSIEVSSSMCLIQQEMSRYNVSAELIVEPTLPSFEIRAKNQSKIHF